MEDVIKDLEEPDLAQLMVATVLKLDKAGIPEVPLLFWMYIISMKFGRIMLINEGKIEYSGLCMFSYNSRGSEKVNKNFVNTLQVEVWQEIKFQYSVTRKTLF